MIIMVTRARIEVNAKAKKTPKNNSNENVIWLVDGRIVNKVQLNLASLD